MFLVQLAAARVARGTRLNIDAFILKELERHWTYPVAERHLDPLTPSWTRQAYKHSRDALGNACRLPLSERSAKAPRATREVEACRSWSRSAVSLTSALPNSVPFIWHAARVTSADVESFSSGALARWREEGEISGEGKKVDTAAGTHVGALFGHGRGGRLVDDQTVATSSSGLHWTCSLPGLSVQRYVAEWQSWRILKEKERDLSSRST